MNSASIYFGCFLIFHLNVRCQMVSGSFFSAVAKVSATIIGFALAVFTVYFQINRQSRLDQTEEVIKLVEEFADEYYDVLKRTRSLILHEVGPDVNTNYQYEWVHYTPEELKETIQNDPNVEAPEATYVYSLFAGIEHMCRNTAEKRTAAGEIPNRQIFEKLPELIEALNDYFHPFKYGQEWTKLFREITGYTGSPESVESKFDTDILPNEQSEYYFDSLFHWIKSNNELPKRPYEHFDANGLGIASVFFLTRSMLADYKNINQELRGSLINYNPNEELSDLLHKPGSVAIITFGLIIPLTMLIESPHLSSIIVPYIPTTILTELIQILTVPILILGFYYQFRRIYKEIINVENS